MTSLLEEKAITPVVAFVDVLAVAPSRTTPGALTGSVPNARRDWAGPPAGTGQLRVLARISSARVVTPNGPRAAEQAPISGDAITSDKGSNPERLR